MKTGAAAANVAERLVAAERAYAAFLAERGLAGPLADVSVHVSKRRRRLRILAAGRVVAEFAVIVGRNPLGHKQREGDERTPEGHYRICYRNAASRFHLFLGLDYPNLEDARAGLAEGRLDEAALESIRYGLEADGRPDWYTPLGGEVGLHGGGTERDGTAGCIAMADEEIAIVWAATRLGTPVTITAD